MLKDEDNKRFVAKLKAVSLKIDDKTYTLPIKEYDDIQNNYKSTIPNLCQKAYNIGYFDNDRISYTSVLYRALWTILLSNKDSAKDIKIINDAIEVYLTSDDLITPMSHNKAVNNYLKKHINQSYNEFKESIYDKYGFNTDEYKNIRIDKRQGNPDFMIYEKQDLQEIITSIFINLKSDFKKDTEIDFIEKVKNEVQSQNYYPIYKPSYKYPKLAILDNNTVGFEFSILDEEKDIISEFEKIYKLEISNKRKYSSSITNELLNILDEENDDKFKSAKDILKSALIYQYQQQPDIGSLEKAMLVYNFHLFTANFKEAEEDTENQEYNFKSSYLINEYAVKKEIRLQIIQLKSLLNLND